MHLRVFTELKGNAACTGAPAQRSARVSARVKIADIFRMSHISTFYSEGHFTLNAHSGGQESDSITHAVSELCFYIALHLMNSCHI